MPTEAQEAVELRLHIGGEWLEAASGETFTSESPATGEVLAVVPAAGREDARRAIEAAGRARHAMAALGVRERASLCEAIAEPDRRRVEGARPDAVARAGQAAARGARRGRVRRRPLPRCRRVRGASGNRAPSVARPERVLTIRQAHGVVAVITPWNYPVGIPSEYLSAARGRATAVVWKPAPTTSLVAAELLRCLLEADAPEGACNLLFGGKEVGAEIVSNPGTHGVGFTGASRSATRCEAGRRKAAAARARRQRPRDPRRCGRGAGGRGDGVRLLQQRRPDLPVERAHPSRRAGRRHLRSRGGRRESIRLGHPLDDETTMGPLNNEGVAQKMDEHVADAVAKGAVVVAGGERAEGFPTQLYYRPSVLDRGASRIADRRRGDVRPDRAAHHGQRRRRGDRRRELVPLQALLPSSPAASAARSASRNGWSAASSTSTRPPRTGTDGRRSAATRARRAA